MSKGIILAGGLGTRLRPLTHVANKHLLPVYNLPMIYLPLRTLINMGCDDILIVSGGEHIDKFAEVLEDGSQHGINITFRVQPEPGGIAQALKYAQGFIQINEAQSTIPVILGDNYYSESVTRPSEESIVVASVPDPERFGVYDPETNTITEKPEKPASDLAVTGLYFFKSRTIYSLDRFQPSARGEYEITDVNNMILKAGAQVIHYRGYWSDMGTFDSLLEVANRVKKQDNNEWMKYGLEL